MPKFKNVSGELVDIPALDLRVPAGETFESDDETLGSNPHFAQIKSAPATPAANPTPARAPRKTAKAAPAKTDGSN